MAKPAAWHASIMILILGRQPQHCSEPKLLANTAVSTDLSASGSMCLSTMQSLYCHAICSMHMAPLTSVHDMQLAKADLQKIAESLNQAQDTYKLLLSKRNELAKCVEKLKLLEAWQVCCCTLSCVILRQALCQSHCICAQAGCFCALVLLPQQHVFDAAEHCMQCSMCRQLHTIDCWVQNHLLEVCLLQISSCPSSHELTVATFYLFDWKQQQFNNNVLNL